ncbi:MULTISPECIES: hypothetical protein [Ramlibacter]|uniref:ATP-grasp domain-containing protein n=1 Tax=Ramlibacter pinisoli TaxID=2682844 RepID=A0A6N8IZB4_9BURK|nr:MULTISPECIES: hypothetical protein [Ramlibacter]MBA2962392.1 hypothetical protein [Ramlibacter sp. CGMCC 1.13660]MVQ32334.1 hypothetical protein [Ramlibacter pinisoli]
MLLASYLSHAAAVQRAAARLGIDAWTRMADFSLHLRREGTSLRWRPSFITTTGSGQAYTDQLTPASTGFAGWFPYPLRRWPLATDKARFKHEAQALGLRTPAACHDAGQIGGPYLAKAIHSSFGQGLRGPWPAHDPADPDQQLRADEYYENFLLGVSAKAWCWAGRCLALELVRPAIVTGDGTATLRQLVQALPHAKGRHDWSLVAHLALFAGLDHVDAIVPAQREVAVEYRYGSVYRDPLEPSINALDEARADGLAGQFHDAARRLQAHVPAFDDPAPTLYTLDAVVDAQGQAWFLEMNCNPTVHPHAYEALLATVFGAQPAPAAVLAVA